MSLGRTFVVIALAVSIAGCSDDSKGDSADGVIRRHVEALDAEDVDGAMDLRCRAARVAPDQHSVFLTELQRLKRAAGGRLEVGDLREVTPVRLLDPAADPVEHEFELRLKVGNATSAPVVVGTITEGGRQRVCSWSVADSFAVRDELRTTDLTPVPARVLDLRNLTTGARAALAVKAGPDSSAKGSDGEDLEGWTAAWTTGDFGGGRITAVRYATSDDAVAHGKQIIDRFAPSATGLFPVPSAPSGIGMRYTASAWTGVQPADVGPQIDMAVVVYDDTVVVIAVSGLDPTADHSAVTDAASAVAGRIVEP